MSHYKSTIDLDMVAPSGSLWYQFDALPRKFMKELVSILLSLACFSHAEARNDGDSIEADLQLSAELKSESEIQPGEPIRIELGLANLSKSTTHRIIKPGDGSSVGWRQPHVYFSVQHQNEDGKWTDAPVARYGRCGLFDADWPKDFFDLEPGATLDLNDWLTAVHHRFEFQDAGEYRVRAHYDFGVQMRRDRTELPDSVRDIPTFQLSSEPIMVTVQRPLELRLTVKRDLIVKEGARLSDLFDCVLVNESSAEMDVSSPTLHADARIGFEIDGKFAGWPPRIDKQADQYGIKRRIRPQEALPLLGSHKFANGMDGTWTYPVPDTVKVRAIYTRSTWKASGVIKSDWAEVTVNPIK